MDMDDDRHLVRRLLRGDEAAFDAFFDAYFQRLFRFALIRLDHNDDAAQEIVQATFVKAIDKLVTFRRDANLFTWLCTICRHQIIDHHRRRRRAATEPLEDSPGVRAALESLAETLDSPADAHERREVARLVHATLDHLPGHYGDALEMRYLDGLSVPEIARRLELGYKATESILSRARAAFREGFESVMAMAQAARTEA